MARRLALLTLLVFSSSLFGMGEIIDGSAIQDSPIEFRQVTDKREFMQRQEDLIAVHDAVYRELYRGNVPEYFYPEISHLFRERLCEIACRSFESMIIIFAERDQKLIGFALFRQIAAQEVELELVCAELSCWVSGAGLIFSIQEHVVDLRKINVEVLRVNLQALQFYEALGFEKTNCLHESDELQEVQRFEYIFPNVPFMPSSPIPPENSF